MKQIRFVFDLDGTVTAEETLPLIAAYFGVEDAIEPLTRETIAGNVPFVESFIERVRILGGFPVSVVGDLLARVPLHPMLHQFITDNADICCVATGNLDHWISRLMRRVGCAYFASHGTVENDRVTALTHILKKESVVEMFQQQGEYVVFIGDGNNDMEAMRLADTAIAAGLTHHPAPGVLRVADHAAFSEEELCRVLHRLLSRTQA